jgi:hypothetical protein
MPANSVICPHCGKRSRLELSEEESHINCLACGGRISRDSFQPSAEIAEEVGCVEDESEKLLKKKHRNKPSNSKRRSKRLLIAGAPPWAWALFFYIFGGLSSGGAVAAFLLYFQSDRSGQADSAKNGGSTSSDKPKTSGNQSGLTNAVNLPPDLAAGKPVSVPPEMFRPVPEANTDRGWPIYVVSEEGFSLAIPPEWRQVDTSPGKYEANYRQLLRMNPQFQFLGGIQSQMSPTIKFFGMDEPSLSTGFATNVNVVHVGSPPDATLDAVIEGMLGDLKKVPMISKPISHERVKVGAGECELLRFKVTVPLPGTNQVTAVTQYVFISSNGVYIVSMNTTINREDHYGPIFEKIGQTFRLIGRRDRD